MCACVRYEISGLLVWLYSKVSICILSARAVFFFFLWHDRDFLKNGLLGFYLNASLLSWFVILQYHAHTRDERKCTYSTCVEKSSFLSPLINGVGEINIRVRCLIWFLGRVGKRSLSSSISSFFSLFLHLKSECKRRKFGAEGARARAWAGI